ncbi:type IV secretion system VirB6 family domain protein, partial [Anaplasma phagocytophilum str. CRT53-1]
EKGSDDADVKGFSREDGRISEVTELDVQRDDQEKGSGDADVKGFSREDGGLSEVTEPDAQRDDQEKDGNTATELPREVVPEATEYGTKPDDQDGDKSDARPERLDPDIRGGSAEVDAKHEVVGDESPVVMVSTEDVPNVEASRVDDKHYTGEGESLAEVASTDVVAEENVVSAGGEGLDATLGARVAAAGDALEATALAPGDAALETVDVPVYQEKGSDDADVKGFSREDGRISEVTEPDAQRDDQEKDGNTATELPREVVPEATEYGAKPDDPDGDKSDARPGRLDPDTGDGSAIEDEVEVRFSRSSESTDSVPSDDAAGVDKHYSADDESPEGMAATETEAKAVVTAGGEGLDATLGARVTAAGDALEATALAPGDAALETVDVPVYQEKGSGDADVKDLSREDGRISEVTELDAQRDDQEKDGNTATELPREVVPEATEYGTKPDDQDGDKGDARPGRLDPDTGDGGVELDAKHEVGDESPVVMVSTEDVPNVEASRVDDKHYTGEGESLAEVASTDVVAEENVVSAGGEGLDATLGARVTAAGDALEATALAPGDAALETVDVPVYQEKGSDDGAEKLPKEKEEIVPEAGTRRDDQEKDGNTATELPREVVPEATEYGTKPDDQDGDKSDSRPERLDPNTGDGGVELDAKHEVGDESPVVMVSTEDVPNVEASRVEDKHYTGEGVSPAEVASTDVVAEENVVSAGDEGLDATLGARVAAAGDALEAAASAPGDAALETVDVPVYQEKGSDDGAEKLPKEKEEIVPEAGTRRDDQDGDKSDSGSEKSGSDSGDAESENETKERYFWDERYGEVLFADYGKVEDGGLSEVTEPDAQRDDQEKGSGDADVKGFSREDGRISEVTEPDVQRDDQEKDGNTATELPREVVPEATEYGAKPDDPDGDKSDARPGRLDPDTGDGSAIEDEVEVRFSRSSESTDSVPSDDAAGVDKHYSADDESPEGMAATETEAKAVVTAGGEGLDATLGARVTAAGDALEATASAPGDAALETVDVPVYQEKGSGDADVKDLSREDGRISEVTEPDAQRDDQEKDGNTATELPREVVPEATEYGAKPDDPDGDKSDARPGRLDPDTGDGSAIEDEVEVRFSRSSESTDSVPSDDAAGVDKHYSADDESPEGMAATETEAKAVVTAGGEGLDATLGARVTAAGDALEATALAPGDAALETLDVPVYQEKGSGDADVKDLSREDGRISEVTELDAQRDDQEKDGNTATELPREVVPEATEYGTKPDDQDGDKSDARPERLDPDIRGGSAEVDAKHEVVGDESPVVMVSTEDVPNVEASRVDDKHYTGEGESLAEVASTDVVAEENVVSAGGEGLDATLGARVAAAGDALEAAASAPGDAALETVDVPVYQEKGSGDADVKDLSREDGRISEVTELDAQRDDQEKDGNTATELPREVVPEATEYGTKPDDQDGDKSDARPERLDPDTGDGGVELDAKHEVGDESPVVMVSTEDVPNVEASRVDDKHYTGEGESLAEVASTDVVAEENVVSAGGEGLDATLGARVTVAGDALEATALAPGDAALETVDVPVYQEKGSDDGAEKLPKEKEEIVPEAGTRRDDQDGDKSDSGSEKSGSDSGDAESENETKERYFWDERYGEVLFADYGKVEDGGLSEVTELDAQRDDQEKDGNTATELPREVVPEATEYGTKPDDQDGDKSDARPERLDPDTGDGGVELDAKHEVVGDESPVVMVSTEDVPNVEASRVDDKHYTGEGVSPAEVASTDVVAEENVVSAGDEGLVSTLGARVAAAGDALEATALAPGDAALETVDVPVYQEKGSDDGAEKLSKEKEEIVPEAGTRRDDQDGDKGDLRLERLDPDTGDGGVELDAKHEVVGDESPVVMVSTEDVPNVEASRVEDKHYTGEGESPAEVASTDVVAEENVVSAGGEGLDATLGARVTAAGDALEATASAPGDAALETVEIPVYQEKGSDDGAEKLPKEKEEIVPEATEYGTKPDDQDGDKSDARPERLDPDTGDGGVELDAKHEVVGDESPVVMVSTEDVPNVEASRVDDKHYTGEGESLAEVASTDVVAEENVVSAGGEGLDATLGARVAAAGDALEAAASAPGDAALETVDVPVYQEKGTDDGAEKLPKEKEEIVPEAGTRRDDQEKDGNTATELPREVVPEATEYGTKPDDQDGDKSDARPERLDPDTGDGGVELDAKHEVGDESPVVMVSTEDVPNVEASRVDDKHYTGEGESLAEVASTDVVAEENVVSAGGEGLDATLGARVTAAGDALEATALAPGDAALETVEIPVDKEGDKRDPDEVKAGKKKEEREEIGLIVPNIDQKAELEGYKSEEAPAISGIKQDAVVDSRIIEESRVDDKHYTGEGESLAEVASTDVVAEENVVSAGGEGLDATLGARVAAAGDALEAAASAPGDAALETVEIPVYQEKGSDDADVKGFSREDGRISEVTELDVQRDDQEKGSGDADVKGFSREDGGLSEVTEPDAQRDDQEKD